MPAAPRRCNVRAVLTLVVIALMLGGCATNPATTQAYFLLVEDVASGDNPADGLQVVHSVAIPLGHGRGYHYEDTEAAWPRNYQGKFHINARGAGEITFTMTEPDRKPARSTSFKVILPPEIPSVTGPFYAPDDESCKKPFYRAMTLSRTPKPRTVSEMPFR
ncbi:hypothetical protein IT570_10980 [Candidatus Sumerlaeota bacterium]|nr:hypothetical protein [Candidatus Sumerlaeota bacterium]